MNSYWSIALSDNRKHHKSGPVINYLESNGFTCTLNSIISPTNGLYDRTYFMKHSYCMIMKTVRYQ